MAKNRSSVNQQLELKQKKQHKSYVAAASKFLIELKISIKDSLKYCWWFLVTGSPHSHAWQWSFMARDLIQDFCSSANTVAMGTKEQLPYNWINIRLLLRHSALCWELIQIPPQAPSTCPWICMPLVINMCSVYNVCAVAYTVDKELCTDYPGRETWYTSSPLISFSATGPLRLRVAVLVKLQCN